MSYHPFPYSHLEEVATSFRRDHGKLDGKRFMIEYVVDQLGIELIPVRGLRDEEGIEAYLPKRPNTIIVDRDAMDAGQPRYLFTLTEEIAHTLIHLKGRSVEELYGDVLKMSESEYDQFEWDAKYLAGAILMPKDEFSALFNQYVDKQKKALGSRGDRDTIIRYAIRHLYMSYGVSFECAAIRCRALGLIDGRDLARLRASRPVAFASSPKFLKR